MSKSHTVIFLFLLNTFYLSNTHGWSGGEPLIFPDSSYWYTQTTGFSPVTARSISAVSDKVCWQAGDMGNIIRTTDGGNNWLLINPAILDSQSIEFIEGINEERALIAVSMPDSSLIYLTSDGGTTWNRVFSQAGGSIRRIKMIDPGKGIAIGDPIGSQWIVIETNDSGKTWSFAPTLPPQINDETGIFDFGTLDTSFLWFSNNVGRRYFSETWGSSWLFNPDSSINTSKWLVCANARHSWLWIGEYDAYYYGETGYVVVNHPALLHPTLKKLLGVIGTMEFWLQLNDHIYYTPNGGYTWSTSSPHGLDHRISTFDIESRGSEISGWAIGIGDTVFHYSRRLTSVEEPPLPIPQYFTLSQNYPNPFNPETHIRFTVPKADRILITIFDALGQEVALLINQDYGPGTYELVWEPHGLPSGSYFCRLQAGGISITKKLFYLK